MNTARNCAEVLTAGHQLVEGQITLELQGLNIAVRSNSSELLEKLGTYFAHTLGNAAADIEVIAIDASPNTFGIDFTDWKREPGKSGRKDAYFDLSDGRLIHKVRTGMIFLQSHHHVIAHGPGLENDNQVINFINAQYMNHLQNNGMLICHASALTRKGHAMGIAGFSGGGKSTLMLHLMGATGVNYMTNDRLFIQDGQATGIPKLPRVNPGTMLNDDNLKSLLNEERQNELRNMPVQNLWELEEKYDVFIEDVYGEGRIRDHGPIDSFLLLNWKRESSEPFSIHEINIEQRRDLLATVMKSPGPFYQQANGSFQKDDGSFDEQRYLDELNKLTIYEARGRIDFERAKAYCLENILS